MIVQFRMGNFIQTVFVTSFHAKEFSLGNLKDLSSHIMDLPDWTTPQMFKILYEYLQDKLPANEQIKVLQAHKLLWLADHLDLSKFADFIIKRVIIPSIEPTNCLLYLTQSYKKLNSKEDESLASWYQMLNLSMNTAAKCLEKLSADSVDELNKVDHKIMHEILQRSFKFRKSRTEREAIIAIMKDLRVYQYSSLPDILQQRRKMITEKRVYHENSANIIKTINLKNDKSEKETNIFSLNDFTWRLITRRKADELQICLKILQRTQPELPNQIVSVYFHSKIQKLSSEKNYSKANMIVGIDPQVQISQFSTTPFRSLNKQRIEFSMFVGIDYTSSALLNYIADSYQMYMSPEMAVKYCFDDVKTLLKKFKGVVASLFLLNFYIAFAKLVDGISDFETIIDLKGIPTDELSAYVKNSKYTMPQQIKRILESELAARGQSMPILQPSDSINRKPDSSSIHPLANSTRSLVKQPTREPSASKVQNSRVAKRHTEIMERIDIRNFIRGSRPDMLAEFKSLRTDQQGSPLIKMIGQRIQMK